MFHSCFVSNASEKIIRIKSSFLFFKSSCNSRNSSKLVVQIVGNQLVFQTYRMHNNSWKLISEMHVVLTHTSVSVGWQLT
jgi:hypothetical protein